MEICGHDPKVTTDPIYDAVIAGDIAWLTSLLERETNRPHLLNAHGINHNTIPILAVKHHPDVLGFLLDWAQAQRFDLQLEKPNDMGKTVMHYACILDVRDIAIRLARGHPKLLAGEFPMGEWPIVYACMANRDRMVMQLLPLYRSCHQLMCQLIITACNYSALSTLQALAHHMGGAFDINMTDPETLFSLAELAALRGNPDLFRWILSHPKLDLMGSGDRQNCHRVLIHACEAGFAEGVSMLLKHPGLHLSRKNYEDAIAVAYERHQVETSEVLWQHIDGISTYRRPFRDPHRDEMALRLMYILRQALVADSVEMVESLVKRVPHLALLVMGMALESGSTTIITAWLSRGARIPEQIIPWACRVPPEAFRHILSWPPSGQFAVYARNLCGVRDPDNLMRLLWRVSAGDPHIPTLDDIRQDLTLAGIGHTHAHGMYLINFDPRGSALSPKLAAMFTRELGVVERLLDAGYLEAPPSCLAGEDKQPTRQSRFWHQIGKLPPELRSMVISKVYAAERGPHHITADDVRYVTREFTKKAPAQQKMDDRAKSAGPAHPNKKLKKAN